MIITRTREGMGSVLSIESYLDDIQRTQVLTLENMVGYIEEVNTNFLDFVRNTIPFMGDRAYKEAIKKSDAAISLTFSMTNVDMSKIKLNIPDGLNGNVLATLEALINGHNIITNELNEVLPVVMSDIGRCINAKEGVFTPPASLIKMRELKVRREVLQDAISANYKTTKSVPYGLMIDFFRSTEEVRLSYDRLRLLDATLHDVTANALLKKIQRLDSSTKALVNKIKDSDSETVRDNRSAKEIAEVVYEVAKSMEFVGYIRANSLQMYKMFGDLSKSIVQYS